MDDRPPHLKGCVVIVLSVAHVASGWAMARAGGGMWGRRVSSLSLVVVTGRLARSCPWAGDPPGPVGNLAADPARDLPAGLWQPVVAGGWKTSPIAKVTTMTQAIQFSGPGSQDLLSPPIAPALWRVAGGLAIAHVVVMMAGFSQEKSTMLSDGNDVVRDTFAGAHGSVVLAGALVEASAFLLVLPVFTFLARALGRRSESGRWAAQTGLAAGIVYVAATLAIGFPPLAAALYGSQHGVTDGAVLALVVNLRNFGYYLTLLALAVQALCVGISALSDSVMRRWAGVGGIAVAAVIILSVVTQGVVGMANIATLLWMVWWIGLGVCLIRVAATRT
jgi:hypothetical protein